MRAAGIPHDVPAGSAVLYVADVVLPAALSMLPPKMDTPTARVMLLAIALQESRCTTRRQVGGPARSFWQAESGGGFRGVVTHDATRELAADVLKRMGYGTPDLSDFDAIEHNDILACIGARLLLFTHPAPLPDNERHAWAYYLATWRPGKPHPETWAAQYALAATLVPA